MPREFVLEHLYDQRAAVLYRRNPPLAGARSLRELVNAAWLTNSITLDPVDEIAPMFLKHGLPAPLLAVQSHSALTLLTVVGHSDVLTLVSTDLAESDLGCTLLSHNTSVVAKCRMALSA